MQRSRQAMLFAILALLWLAVPARATTIALYTLPQGNTILQVTMAAAMATDGGLATSDTRTIYYFAPDFGDPQLNLHDFIGTTWPYVFLDGGLKVDSGITADVTTASTSAGDIILINGNPLYQFVGDNSALDANGNFDPWNFIKPDGSPTQSVVPLPAALPLLASALFGLGWMRRRRKF